MPQAFQYWKPNGELGPAGPGIRILTGDTNYDDVEWDYDGGRRTGYPDEFGAYAGRNLDYIYATPSGRSVLAELIGMGADVTIGFAMLGNNARAANPQGSMTDVAFEIYSTGRPGAATRAALQRLWTGDPRFALFAFRVNRQPRWDINSRPGSDGGWWSLGQLWIDYLHANSSSDLSTNSKFLVPDNVGDWSRGRQSLGVSPAGLNLTETEARNWITNGVAPQRLTELAKTQLKLATVVALERESMPGAGSGSTIGFAINPTSQMNRTRPPGIGLAHEIMHAYFSAKGLQPGHEGPQHWSTVLFEFKCVGLGPWDEATPSENSVRNQWGRPVRAYRNVMDEMNLRVPPKRISY